MTVAKSAATAATAKIIRAVIFGHIMNNLPRFGLFYERSRRDENDKIGGGGAVELGALAVAAVSCHKFALVAEGKKGVRALVNAENDVAAMATVTAVGAAVRDVLFPMEGNCAVAAVSCLEINFYVIDKQEITSFLIW